MPAVTPAEVHTSPSRTQIASASTSTSGGGEPARRRGPSASSPVGRRAVRRRRARRRPCRRRRRAATRRPAPPPAPTSAASAHAGRTPDPPGTTSVSTSWCRWVDARVGDQRQAALGAHGTGRRGGDRHARSRRRRLRRRGGVVAPANTSWGPVTSSACTPSKATMTTAPGVRPRHGVSLGVAGDGVNDDHPTDPATKPCAGPRPPAQRSRSVPPQRPVPCDPRPHRAERDRGRPNRRDPCAS